MSQFRLHFNAPHKIAESLLPVIEDCFEEDGFPVAAFEIDEETQLWSISLYVYDQDEAVIRERLAAFTTGTGLSDGIRCEQLGDENWVEKTLHELAPVKAGRFVVHGSHDAGCTSPHEFDILVDAGMAFGTGHHGTTAGCLNMINREIKRSKITKALDLGSGTGVLAIAIAKALRIPVLASDIDPIAAEIAENNARINNVGAYIESITSTGFNNNRFAAWVPFDLIVANILARPLQSLAHDLSCHLAPKGTVILSGLLPHQKARIVATYRAQGMALEHVHYQDGWMTLVLKNMR